MADVLPGDLLVANVEARGWEIVHIPASTAPHPVFVVEFRGRMRPGCAVLALTERGFVVSDGQAQRDADGSPFCVAVLPAGNACHVDTRSFRVVRGHAVMQENTRNR